MIASERLAVAVEAVQAGEPIEDAARRLDVPAEDVENVLRALAVLE